MQKITLYFISFILLVFILSALFFAGAERTRLPDDHQTVEPHAEYKGEGGMMQSLKKTISDDVSDNNFVNSTEQKSIREKPDDSPETLNVRRAVAEEIQPFPGDKVEKITKQKVLKEQHIQDLLYFLQELNNSQFRFEPEDHDLINTVMSRLCNFHPPPENLSKLLIDLSVNQPIDEVVRDYALQHLRYFYPKSPAKTDILDTMWRSLSETDNSIAGTALMALADIAQYESNLSTEAVSQSALRLALDETAGELVRISAIQVCASLSVKDLLPEAERISVQSSRLPLRLSAISSLGALGDKETLATIESVLSDSEPVIQHAGKIALKKLHQRLSKNEDV